MSGTSADGIDAVVAKISGSGRTLRAKIIAHHHQRFTPTLRAQVVNVGLHGHVAEICELNFALGERFADAALAVIQKAGLRPGQITAIGSHGQTIHHLPNAKYPSTLQIGEPCVIAERTGITTVGDFRVRDMAAGGQGAPLVPYTDWVLFTHDSRPRIVQNIGGIGNLTFLPPRARLTEVRAFDTGPGNMVMDALMTKLSRGKLNCDRGGKWAARGGVSEKLLVQCMAHPYLRRNPPKTTGREEFGEMFLREFLTNGRKLKLGDDDLVATATAFTAESIADAYRRFVFPKIKLAALPKLQIILGGGGAKNPTLVRMLEQRLGQSLCAHRASAVKTDADEPQRRDDRREAERGVSVEIPTHEDFGMDSSAKEPLAFAIMAHETWLGQQSNVPSVTGARKAVVLGKIVPGRC
ncbi:MAG: anhydro-N-acetylmuramic acid kinase [Pedosphaera sp.]|nr:anhydro-N-acetylmuramic acid kinase [Pedosphaera sp.]